MMSFKVVCAKNNKKIELIVKYNSLDEAKEGLHKQGYSIIEIKEEIDSNIENGGIFYFDLIIDGKIKTGEIKSNDIFKAYIRLVEDLKYEIIYIYDDKETDEKNKILLTGKVKEGYKIYNQIKGKVESVQKNQIENNQNNKKESNLSEFVKNEINYYYNLIDEVLIKIDYIINNYSKNIDVITINKLQQLYNGLKQIKNITNINKLKIIGETALLKIGELQIELMSKNILESKDNILKETNKLLKKFGSNKQVKIEQDDIILKIKNFITDFLNDILFLKNKEDIKIETNTYIYYENLRELHIYKQKLRKINLDLIKLFFLFQKEKSIKLNIKKKLIIQNITLIKNRLSKTKFSYVKIIKGFEYYKNSILFFLQKIGDLFIYSIFIYSIFFIYLNIFNKTNQINNYIIYIIILIAALGLLLKYTKNLIFIGIGSFIYILLFIILNINF